MSPLFGDVSSDLEICSHWRRVGPEGVGTSVRHSTSIAALLLTSGGLSDPLRRKGGRSA